MSGSTMDTQSMWAEASGDFAVEQESQRFARAKVEASSYWPFLADASTPADFNRRQAMVSSELRGKLATALPDLNEPQVGEYHTRILASQAGDYELLHTQRVSAQTAKDQARTAILGAFTAEAKKVKTADVVDDFAKINKTLHDNNWVITGHDPDGTEFKYLSDEVPSEMRRYYDRLTQAGYASGVLASKQADTTTRDSTAPSKVVKSWGENGHNPDGVCPHCGASGFDGENCSHCGFRPGGGTSQKSSAVTQKESYLAVRPTPGNPTCPQCGYQGLMADIMDTNTHQAVGQDCGNCTYYKDLNPAVPQVVDPNQLSLYSKKTASISDRSLAHAVLIEHAPQFRRMASVQQETVKDQMLSSFLASGEKNVYDFGKTWAKQAERKQALHGSWDAESGIVSVYDDSMGSDSMPVFEGEADSDAEVPGVLSAAGFSMGNPVPDGDGGATFQVTGSRKQADSSVPCDSCGKPITSQKRLDAYDNLGVDWALCAACEKETQDYLHKDSSKTAAPVNPANPYSFSGPGDPDSMGAEYAAGSGAQPRQMPGTSPGPMPGGNAPQTAQPTPGMTPAPGGVTPAGSGMNDGDADDPANPKPKNTGATPGGTNRGAGTSSKAQAQWRQPPPETQALAKVRSKLNEITGSLVSEQKLSAHEAQKTARETVAAYPLMVSGVDQELVHASLQALGGAECPVCDKNMGDSHYPGQNKDSHLVSAHPDTDEGKAAKERISDSLASGEAN